MSRRSRRSIAAAAAMAAPVRRSRRGRQQEEDEQDEDVLDVVGDEAVGDAGSDGEELTFTQAESQWEAAQMLDLTQSLPTKEVLNFNNRDEEEKELLVNKCVRFLILKGCVGRKPIQTSRLRALVLSGSAYKGSRIVRPLLARAQERIRTMFGLDLAIARQVKFSSAVDLDAVQKSGPQIVKDTYYLKNVLKDQAYLQRLNSLDGKAAAVRGLATVILAVILLNDKVAPENVLMKTLSDIDGSLAKKVAARRSDDEHTYEWLYHDVLGDVAAVVDGLVADKILLKTKAPDAEQYEYRLGERAVTEIGARDIAEFILQLTKKTLPENVITEFLGAYAELTPEEVAEAKNNEGSDDEGSQRSKREKTKAVANGKSKANGKGKGKGKSKGKGKGKGKAKRHRGEESTDEEEEVSPRAPKRSRRRR